MTNVLIRVLELAKVIVLIVVRIILSSKFPLSDRFTEFLDWLSSIWRGNLLIQVRNVFIIDFSLRVIWSISRNEISREILVLTSIESFCLWKLKGSVLSLCLNLGLLVDLWIIDILILKPRHLKWLTVGVPHIALWCNLLLLGHLQIFWVVRFLGTEILVIHSLRNDNVTSKLV